MRKKPKGISLIKMYKLPEWIIYVLLLFALYISIFYLLTLIQTRNKEEKTRIKKFRNITFIIPAFNVAGCIRGTVDSVLNLEYPKKNIHIIVVDDGSTDGTLKIIKEISNANKNIKIFTKRHEGKAIAVNYGLSRAKTELVAVLDSDTILEKDIALKAVPLLENEEIMAVTARLVPFNRRGFFARMQFIEYAITSLFRKLLSNINSLPIAPAFTIYKKKFFDMHGKFDEHNLTEDFEMALRIHKYNYGIKYVLNSYAKTVVPETFQNLSRQRIRWGYGTLHNLFRKYKELFGLSHGDLGLFFLPTVITGIIFVIVALSISFYILMVSLIHYITIFRLGWLPSFRFDLFGIIVSLSYPRVILGISEFVISLFFLWMINKEIEEKVSLFEYFAFILFYTWFIAYFYIMSIIRFFSKKPSW